MNEKKAIVFFFFVVFFFCFSSSSSCWWWCWFLRRTSRIRLSRSPFLFWVCVCMCSSSPSPSSCAHLRLFCSHVVYVCVCVFQFPLFAVVVAVFFGGLTVFQTLLPFLRALGFFFVFCFNVVIRGGVFLHFFCCIEQNTLTCPRTRTRGHTHADGRSEKSARAPLVLGRQHTQNYFAFFLYCCVLLLLL